MTLYVRYWRSMGLRGSFFITTGHVGWPQRVTWGQLREMSDAGFSIQSHSRTHSYLSSYEPDKLREELRQSKNDLEQHLGRRVIAFAPPYGDWPQHAASIANTCGYQIICTSRPGFNDSPFQFQKLRRFSMRGPTSHAKSARLPWWKPDHITRCSLSRVAVTRREGVSQHQTISCASECRLTDASGFPSVMASLCFPALPRLQRCLFTRLDSMDEFEIDRKCESHLCEPKTAPSTSQDIARRDMAS